MLPTPTAADSRASANETAGRTRRLIGHAGRTLTDAARLLPIPPIPLTPLLPTPRATDGTKGSPRQRGSHGDLTLPSSVIALGRDPAAQDSPLGGPLTPGRTSTDSSFHRSRWGDYAEAVTRWEQLINRSVPEPTIAGRHGKPVLAPVFVEWLMGLQTHWVTDPAFGIPRTRALHVLGAGVVPQQAEVALRILLCTHWLIPHQA